jgi:hypothetical protein
MSMVLKLSEILGAKVAVTREAARLLEPHVDRAPAGEELVLDCGGLLVLTPSFLDELLRVVLGDEGAGFRRTLRLVRPPAGLAGKRQAVGRSHWVSIRDDGAETWLIEPVTTGMPQSLRAMPARWRSMHAVESIGDVCYLAVLAIHGIMGSARGDEGVIHNPSADNPPVRLARLVAVAVETLRLPERTGFAQLGRNSLGHDVVTVPSDTSAILEAWRRYRQSGGEPLPEYGDQPAVLAAWFDLLALANTGAPFQIGNVAARSGHEALVIAVRELAGALGDLCVDQACAVSWNQVQQLFPWWQRLDEARRGLEQARKALRLERETARQVLHRALNGG